MKEKRPITERLDEASKILAESGDRFTEGFDQVMEAYTGEIELHHPDAPERDDYDGRDHGYREYLEDCHEWAIAELNAAIAGAEDALSEFSDRVDEHPEPALRRIEDEEQREETYEGYDTVTDAMPRVQEAYARLAKIEEAFSDEL